MGFKITTLMENFAKKDIYLSEHGLSLLIEGNDVRILYDTGSSPLFLKNASALHADLHHLDALVLSHGHYDHTGGVDTIITHRLYPPKIYLGKHFFDQRYIKKQDGMKEIGAAFDRNAIVDMKISIEEVDTTPVNVGDGVWVVSGFVTTDPAEKLSADMMRLENGVMKQDIFQDELVLVLETEDELAVISGCSHVGILSIIHHVSELFGRPVTTFIGGTHLVDSSDERIKYTCGHLKKKGITRLGACHCNGERAASYFEQNFSGFFRNNVGTQTSID